MNRLCVAAGAITVALLLCSSARAADEGGKVDFTASILDLDDVPLMECADKVSDAKPGDPPICKMHKVVTLGMITARAMCAGEQGASMDEVFKRCQLGVQTAKVRDALLSPEEKAAFRKQIGRVYGAQSGLIVMRAVTLVDPTPPK